MEDLLLILEKDKLYQDLLKTLSKEEQKEFVLEVEKMAANMNKICDSFDNLMQQDDGPDKFMKVVGNAINRRSFYGNNGVTEIPWPEKN